MATLASASATSCIAGGFQKLRVSLIGIVARGGGAYFAASRSMFSNDVCRTSVPLTM